MPDHAPSPDGLEIVTAAQLAQLAAQAAAAPRKRTHMLLHAGPDDQVQRLLIAAQPGTYVRPHIHSEQWEMLTVQRGSLDILIFAEDGALLSRSPLDRTTPLVQIPQAHWHGCVVREPDTLIVEVKPGPYRANEFAGWAPEENGAHAGEFVRWIESAEAGQKWRPA